ncbi:hypothetical protein SAMN05428950_10552 [Sphingomonas sp. OV641]|jgi:hypothetical protein|uniref:hypothetical protein n=1 Tax=Sphingomonas sp. OV641 TaxID=1881068 RepID=UPI0008B7C302|nr:hypothetical protein [Sphingomonas sp. OV641]SEJ92318.1 hypothetical protein SAMN05428950_10552 [Sphingomonas sp. OV641]
MYALYFRDLSSRESVTIHKSERLAMDELAARVRLGWLDTLGPRSLDPDVMISRYFETEPAYYSIVKISIRKRNQDI